MSKIKYTIFVVQCDTLDCERIVEGHAGDTWPEVVNAAQRAGWAGGAQSGAKHRCPIHAVRGQ